MAFGTERLREAVVNLTKHVDDFGDSIRAGLTDARTLILDAVTQSRSDLTGRIDSMRVDLGNRIDGTHRNVDELTRELGAARRDIADLHALLQTWRAEAAEARTLTEQEPEPATTGAEPAPAAPAAVAVPAATGGARAEAAEEAEHDPLGRHHQRIRVAAGISQADFTCHRDLWAHFVRKAGNEPHFHIPGCVEEDERNVKVSLSGPTLVAALTAMWRDRDRSKGDATATGDWALADELYEAVAAAIDTVRDTPRHRDQRKVAIVIDRQPSEAVAA